VVGEHLPVTHDFFCQLLDFCGFAHFEIRTIADKFGDQIRHKLQQPSSLAFAAPFHPQKTPIDPSGPHSWIRVFVVDTNRLHSPFHNGSGPETIDYAIYVPQKPPEPWCALPPS
jgi:hypothetical protein